MKKGPVATNDRTLIEGIPRMEWGRNTENSFVRSAQLTLDAIGEHYNYPYLMGISGAAFKFEFNKDWCPSAADATVGFDVSQVLFKALGFEAVMVKIDDRKFSDIRKLYQRITHQIDRGIPIIAINLKTCPEWGIITGYLKKKPGIICRTYFDEGEDYSLADHAPWLSFFIEKKQSPLDKKTLFQQSIQNAILLANTGSFDNYKSGIAAYECWAKHLKLFVEKKAPFKPFEVNLTLIHVLTDSRNAAVKYLTKMCGKIPFKNSQIIIENYQAEYKLLKKLISVLPDFRNGIESWNFGLISQQIEVLNECMKIERETTGLMAEALN